MHRERAVAYWALRQCPPGSLLSIATAIGVTSPPRIGGPVVGSQTATKLKNCLNEVYKPPRVVFLMLASFKGADDRYCRSDCVELLMIGKVQAGQRHPFVATYCY